MYKQVGLVMTGAVKADARGSVCGSVGRGVGVSRGEPGVGGKGVASAEVSGRVSAGSIADVAASTQTLEYSGGSCYGSLLCSDVSAGRPC